MSAVGPRKPLSAFWGFIGAAPERGLTGPPGPQGNPGQTGIRGSMWTAGNGQPSGSANPEDMYLDLQSGDVWRWS